MGKLAKGIQSDTQQVQSLVYMLVLHTLVIFNHAAWQICHDRTLWNFFAKEKLT